MNIEMRRALAQQPFEEKIRKVAQLICLSRKAKAHADPNYFDGTKLSESVLARDWNSPEDRTWQNL